MNDAWKPVATQRILELRAELYAKIRNFFAERNVIEVETPVLNLYGVTDPNIDCLMSNVNGDDLFLHSSPEYAMKRMLAYYKKDMFQICKVFRNEETGRFHHPEFTMLEWYRLNWSYTELIKEVDELIKTLLAGYLNLKPTCTLSF